MLEPAANARPTWKPGVPHQVKVTLLLININEGQ